MNNSKYYYNYRMVSNILALYNNLKSMGYTDREIQVQNNQCTYNLPANIPPGHQRIEDDNISLNLVNKDIQLDLNLEDVSLKRHIMSVANRHEQYDSLNKR
jgi:glycosylphosphatidylinositol transamidase (GPIT) subunit GPI8